MSSSIQLASRRMAATTARGSSGVSFAAATRQKTLWAPQQQQRFLSSNSPPYSLGWIWNQVKVPKGKFVDVIVVYLECLAWARSTHPSSVARMTHSHFLSYYAHLISCAQALKTFFQRAVVHGNPRHQQRVVVVIKRPRVPRKRRRTLLPKRSKKKRALVELPLATILTTLFLLHLQNPTLSCRHCY